MTEQDSASVSEQKEDVQLLPKLFIDEGHKEVGIFGRRIRFSHPRWSAPWEILLQLAKNRDYTYANFFLKRVAIDAGYDRYGEPLGEAIANLRKSLEANPGERKVITSTYNPEQKAWYYTVQAEVEFVERIEGASFLYPGQSRNSERPRRSPSARSDTNRARSTHASESYDFTKMNFLKTIRPTFSNEIEIVARESLPNDG